MWFMALLETISSSHNHDGRHIFIILVNQLFFPNSYPANETSILMISELHDIHNIIMRGIKNLHSNFFDCSRHLLKASTKTIFIQLVFISFHLIGMARQKRLYYYLRIIILLYNTKF